jgi:N4-gp56 family major capsid protein
MAVQTFGVNDTLSNKLWAKKLTAEALKETYFGKFMGTSPNSMIHMKTEVSKAAGDKVTFGLRMQLSGDGRTEGQTLEGNEEALTLYADSILINELMHAVRVKSENSIDAQRVPFNLREEAKDGLKDWFANRLDTVMFNHLAGYSAQTDARYTGNNTITAPSSGRKVFATGSADETVQASSTSTFNLNLIDKCVETAKTASPLIRPIRVDGENKYVMFLHPYQVYDLRTTTSTGQWLDIQKATLSGGKGDRSPIYTGALGEYNGVVLHESTRVPNGLHSSTSAAQTSTRRAIFCGAQAGALAWGQKYTEGSNYKWVEEMFDYERELGVSAQTVWGIKKTVFNSTDFGVITATSYAAAH